MKNNIITYQEYETGEPPFDWNKMLTHALRGELSEEELEDMELKAGRWPSCACGNLCKTIPRREGSPLDTRLYILGNKFSDFVKQGFYEMAIACLEEIEIRSIEILSGLD